MKSIEEITIEREIRINDIHCIRIIEAIQRLQHLLPAVDSTIKDISFEDISAFTVLTDRFCKLQDSIGAKIFKNLLLFFKENVDKSTTFKDILSRVVQLGIVGSTDYWDRFRKLRNDLTHEYSDDLEVTAKNLNETVLYAKELCEYWQEELKPYLLTKISI